jgi:Family of unknown function (DUF6580)
MGKYLFTFMLILAAVLTRLLPHPPNVTPITAIALFSGVYLDRKHTFIVPLVIMLISDFFIGFHNVMFWVYASFILVGLGGLWLRKHQGITTTVGVTFVGSLIFFIVTNFGVWLSTQTLYAHDLAGLIQCYTAAIPFFRNSLIGDLFYVGALFGLYETAKKYLPTLFVAKSKT